ncbi:hypothetical protein CLOSTASPAR_02140 [[Clostridium] asparagiforme DSM 15981]|uniref:Uncharacterized protein n=1 Tax=[Clostridium] asparagiforme DSM 15981 TaxID=518636 RepID=C0CYR2_9FIRM|nr:hypothetical protein CLOSTASPAR_02140 [[Clostridium] asparagiforme DSM 15981]
MNQTYPVLLSGINFLYAPINLYHLILSPNATIIKQNKEIASFHRGKAWIKAAYV